jgi:hypothetical protein
MDIASGVQSRQLISSGSSSRCGSNLQSSVPTPTRNTSLMLISGLALVNRKSFTVAIFASTWVGTPPPRFWTEVVRRQTLPLYRHPVLVAQGQEKAAYIEPTDGSITDGDDHAWSSDPKVLSGGGGWRGLDSANLACSESVHGCPARTQMAAAQMTSKKSKGSSFHLLTLTIISGLLNFLG